MDSFYYMSEELYSHTPFGNEYNGTIAAFWDKYDIKSIERFNCLRKKFSRDSKLK